MIKFNKEQRIIVTGASSGIGKGTAILLNELGASVIGIGRNVEGLEVMKSHCEYPENCFLEPKDLTEDIEGLPVYVKSLKEKYGKFQGLVLCAGVVDVKPLQMISLDEMKQMFDINYFSQIFMLKGFADRRNNIGAKASVVCVSSVAGVTSPRGLLAYSATKAAFSASAKSVSREVSAQGIRVNSIMPADIEESKMQGQAIRTEFTDYPLETGKVEDVANMIAYLLSDKAKWITGQNYIIDCGGV